MLVTGVVSDVVEYIIFTVVRVNCVVALPEVLAFCVVPFGGSPLIVSCRGREVSRSVATGSVRVHSLADHAPPARGTETAEQFGRENRKHIICC